ncbi:hypothetical protein [Ottowia testudinis]|uniref:Histone deacetylase domain-containing protein n=1 Tax=Ottowia testudinis TaxID=2816950 RepID=A0A975H4M7_9BURK|nr:hypothetical protein [Ottowia testudinis]QTD47029.1 hypothetical protein J1M35_09275 [Ottowia testudinis]
MKAFYSTQFVLPLPPGHRFPMGKYGALRERLTAECRDLTLEQAHPASDAELALAHAPDYIAAVAHGTLEARAQREIGFPFRKVAGDLDVGLPDGTGDAAYLDALDLALVELDSRFRPDAVFYLAGADPHEGDRLGRLKLTYDGLIARDVRVFDWAWRRRLPLALSMGGGYGHDIATTVQVQINTFGVALRYWRRWQNAAP